MAREGVSKKAQSIACLMQCFVQLFFVTDSLIYAISPDFPDRMPKEGIYFNVVLNGTLAYLCYSGWKASGSAMPKMTLPKGRFAKPFLAGSINLLFFGIPLWGQRPSPLFTPLQSPHPPWSLCTPLHPASSPSPRPLPAHGASPRTWATNA